MTTTITIQPAAFGVEIDSYDGEENYISTEVLEPLSEPRTLYIHQGLSLYIAEVRPEDI